MKKILYYSLFISLALIGCDTVDDPLKGDGYETPIDTSTGTVHRVFLEEFTGVKCNNCPDATKEAQRISQLYGDQVILLGIHAGNLAQTDDKHPRAFRTPEGTAFFNDFNLFGVPVAFVNRSGYPDDIIRVQAEWAADVAAELGKPALAEITLNEDSFDTTTRELNVSGEVEVFNSLPTSNTYLCVFLAENDIISPQTMPDKSVNDNYEHDHVFRGTFNSTYGTPIDLSSGKANFSVNLSLISEIVKENCEVIAFVYDRDTYEIFQVNKIEI